MMMVIPKSCAWPQFLDTPEAPHCRDGGWRDVKFVNLFFFFFYNGSCVSCLCFLWVRWRREAWQNPALQMFSGEHKFLLIEHTSEKLSSEGEVILPPASQVSYVVGGKRIYCSRTSVGGFKNLTDPPWLKPGRASRLVLGTET